MRLFGHLSSLQGRLALVMAALVLLTAGATGLFNDHILYKAVYPRALSRLDSHLQLATRGLEDISDQARADVLTMTASTALWGILNAAPDFQDASPGAIDWRARLATEFSRYLVENPSYLQFRLIGTADGGREIVRVDRAEPDGPVRVVGGQDLQQKGNRGYFEQAIGLPEGALYVSPIELNREFGAIQDPHVPVLRVATPVFAAQGNAFAILIINIDMRGVFAEAQAGMEPPRQLYVMNTDGELLLAPDKTREFAFEFGRSARLQDEFAGLADAMTGMKAVAAVVEDAGGARHAVAFRPMELAGKVPVAVAETIPFAEFNAVPAAARYSSLIGAIGAAIGAIILAVLFARTMSRPILQITQAVQAMGRGEAWSVPSDAAGEIGILAGAFKRMAGEVAEKTQALSDEVGRHQQTIAQLRERSASERLMSSAVESSDDAIILQRLDGTITAWNRAAERLFEYPASEAIGRTTEFIVPPDRREELKDILDKVRKGDPVDHFETLRISRSGRQIDVSLSISPVRLPDGTLIGSAKIARDVTERKAEEERFRLAIEASPNGMIVTDASGAIQLVNAEVERLFGYTRDELIGQTVDVLLPVRLRSAHADLRGDFVDDPSARNMGGGRDLFARRKDGTEFPVEVGLNPFNTREGLMVLAALIDITERKEAEDAIAAFTTDLKRSNAELEEFAYIAAHDLQEPLRMVASYTELLSSRYAGQLDERADKYIHYAVDGAKRMKGLINDLLTYSRVGTQGKPLVPTDADATLQSVIRQLKVLIGETGTQIAVNGTLPSVMADEGQLGQLFQNLIGNAIKFRSEEPPHIDIGARQENGYWEFAVSDNGIGMDPEHSSRVFQMFQRLHERGRYEGSGIGLAVSKKIIERHGGRIWFESELGKGTTFHFTLKAASGDRE